MRKTLLERVLSISESRDVEEAVKLQKELSRHITLNDKFSELKLIAGVDLAYDKEQCFCAVVVIDAESMKVVETVFSQMKITFPYIPGLLFYREFPPFISAYKKLKVNPDLLIFDGQGLSHQRMMGIATMAGIILGKPTIGCAKSHLYGEYQMPEDRKFSASELKVKNNVVGYVFRSKENVKPIFISTGYRVSPESALEIAKKFITHYKLPLPTHLAHQACEKFKKERI
jgi:deoxyribonuclease V